jgi:glycosyltransferase involved in cell wall biosynthesis
MRILLDPIYTAAPSKCASNFKMLMLYEHLRQRPDTYFYWVIPEDISPEEKSWYPSNGDIHYVDWPVAEDRMSGYMEMFQNQFDALCFDGSLWDVDLIFTNRSTAASYYRMVTTRATSTRWSKRIVVVDDFPVFSFKGWVMDLCKRDRDVQILAGYSAADAVLITSFWEKAEILRLAKDYVSFSVLKRLKDKIYEVFPGKFETPVLKPASFFETRKDRPFTVTFSGRVVGGQKLDDIFHVWAAQRVKYGLDTLRAIVTAGGRLHSPRVQPPDFVDLQATPREEFWRIVREESDVGIYLSPEEGFSLTVHEALSLGLPIILAKARWSVSQVGENYPFFASGPAQVFAWICAFRADYETNYEKFAKWQEEDFVPLSSIRADNSSFLNAATLQCDLWQTALEVYGAGLKERRAESDTSLLKRVHEVCAVDETVEMFELFRRLGKLEAFRHLEAKLGEPHATRRMAFASEWNLFRLELLTRFNFVDGGVHQSNAMKRIA